MAIETTKMKLTGISPLILHNGRTASPLDPYTQAMKKLTGKRNKTIEDHKELARLEWEAGLYLQDGIVVMPAENIDACLWAGAKKSKLGVLYKTGTTISDDYYPLEYKAPMIAIKQNGDIPNHELDRFYVKLMHQSLVKVGQQRILRTRPIFYDWSVSIAVLVDTAVIEVSQLHKIAEDAGKLVGLGDWRPRKGRFEVEII